MLLAVALVVLMGFSIQQGNTCMVAAVGEVVTQRSTRRFQALLEAGLLVGGILGAASLAGYFEHPPMPYGVGWLTLGGGVVLGVGASLNGACMFGTVARIGSGQWAYLWTPIGFFAGCVALLRAGLAVPDGWLIAAPLSDMPAMLPALVPLLILGALGVFRLQRTARLRLGLSGGGGHGRRAVWTPHVATCLIGVSFAMLMLIAGPWTYPDALADIAQQGPVMAMGQRALLFAALLAGAVLGGWNGPAGPGPVRGLWLRCLAGGFLMALGSMIVPGSNDSLLLLGVPMLWPHALLALLAMGVTIAALHAIAA